LPITLLRALLSLLQVPNPFSVLPQNFRPPHASLRAVPLHSSTLLFDYTRIISLLLLYHASPPTAPLCSGVGLNTNFLIYLPSQSPSQQTLIQVSLLEFIQCGEPELPGPPYPFKSPANILLPLYISLFPLLI